MTITKKPDLESDLLSTDWILSKVRASDSYAQNLYAAICNNEFVKSDSPHQLWRASWRYSGGMVARMQQHGDYLNWYCSGIGGLVGEHGADESDSTWRVLTGYVAESVVTDEIVADLSKLGWAVAKAK